MRFRFSQDSNNLENFKMWLDIDSVNVLIFPKICLTFNFDLCD